MSTMANTIIGLNHYETKFVPQGGLNGRKDRFLRYTPVKHEYEIPAEAAAVIRELTGNHPINPFIDVLPANYIDERRGFTEEGVWGFDCSLEAMDEIYVGLQNFSPFCLAPDMRKKVEHAVDQVNRLVRVVPKFDSETPERRWRNNANALEVFLERIAYQGPCIYSSKGKRGATGSGIMTTSALSGTIYVQWMCIFNPNVGPHGEWASLWPKLREQLPPNSGQLRVSDHPWVPKNERDNPPLVQIFSGHGVYPPAGMVSVAAAIDIFNAMREGRYIA